MSSDLITETILQPRTGSQCPKYKARLNESGELESICQRGSEERDKAMSWDDDYAADLTLGFRERLDTAAGFTAESCKVGENNYWSWGGLDCKAEGCEGTKFLCIDPVERLCGIIEPWDGMNYRPETWETDILMDTVTQGYFPKSCDQLDGASAVGRETTTFTQACPLNCEYDASKFTTLKHVEAYEKKYGKYKRDDKLCNAKTSAFDTYRRCLASSDGKIISTNPKEIYTDNYDRVMINMCSQQSSNCGIEPLSVVAENSTPRKRSKCSNLMSSGPEGKKCKEWLNAHGPYKFSIMESIGNIYCNKYPESEDCNCFSRDNVNNPNYESFHKVSTEIAPLGLKPGCYYRPCADATNYIIGTETFKEPTNNTGDTDSSYGFTCANDVCAQIAIQSDAAYTEMDGNKVYIQCGSGVPPESSLQDHVDDFFQKHTISFSMFLAAFVIFIILILIFIFLSSSSKKPKITNGIK